MRQISYSEYIFRLLRFSTALTFLLYIVFYLITNIGGFRNLIGLSSKQTVSFPLSVFEKKMETTHDINTMKEMDPHLLASLIYHACASCPIFCESSCFLFFSILQTIWHVSSYYLIGVKLTKPLFETLKR